MRARVLLTVAVLSLVAVACGGAARADQPPRIAYGQDVCARCGMIISEARFAAGLVAPDGSQTIFDDPGEMVATVQDQGLRGRRVWVHDFASAQWMDGTQAFYVTTTDGITPMGSGVVAFRSNANATAYLGEHRGSVMTWDAILRDWKLPGTR